MNNPPAFPVVGMNQQGDQQFIGVFEHGMTLRDYFAAKAMELVFDKGYSPNDVGDDTAAAKAAYQIANAMLIERERKL